MKNSIFSIGSCLFIISILFTACQTPTNKERDAVEKVKEDRIELAKSVKELYEIRLDTISDYDQFKLEAQKLIDSQEKQLSALRTKIKEEKKEISADHQKRMAVLESQTKALKQDLVRVKKDGQDQWLSFKSEFNHDMNALELAIKDLSVDNEK